MRSNRGGGAGRASFVGFVTVVALSALTGCSSPAQLAGAPPKPSPKITPLPPVVTATASKDDAEAGANAGGGAEAGATAGGGAATPVLLPSQVLTPGAVFSDIHETDVCGPNYIRGVLHLRSNNKILALSNYGVSTREREYYQVDRLIPVGLGGNNKIANLWIQRIADSPGAKEKDALEVRLHALVCSHKLTLRQAQTAIATNWWTAYTKYVGDTASTAAPKPSKSPAAAPDRYAVINAGPCAKEGQVGYTTNNHIRLTCQILAGTLRWGKRR